MNKNFKPSFQMIGDEAVCGIIDEALSVLARIGVFVENEEARRLLKDARVRIKNSRALVTDALVNDCLESAPKQIAIYDRSGKSVMILGNDHTYFVPGSTAVYFLDSRGEIRKPGTDDYINLVKVVDALPNFVTQSTAMIPKDVPAQIADQYRLLNSLFYSPKPIVTGTFDKQSFSPMKDMLAVVRGSEEKLREKPLAIFDACPSAPLRWSDLTCQALIDCARSGIPVDLISVPLPGAIAPVTLHGALVQHTAENLSGIVISQLACPGAPVIYGGSPAIFDMRYATTPMGAIESMMLDCAYSRIGNFFGLPTHTYMGLSDSKDIDSQMGMESGIGMVLAALSGINVVSGAGMLGAENCQCLEKLIMDNEIGGMALRLKKGIEPSEKGVTEKIIEECLDTGNFLDHPSTRFFRKEQFIPKSFIDRTAIEAWISQKEKRGLREKLQEEVGKILYEHPGVTLDQESQMEISKIWNRSLKKAD